MTTYPNPSKFSIVSQTTSNLTTFEIFFHFSPSLSNLLILAVLSTCIVWVIVMNLMIIGALLNDKKDKEHNVTNLYLINLLFADVLLGVFVFPFMSMVTLIGYFPLSPAWCNLWVYFDYYLIIASSYGFAALMTHYLLILRWAEYYPASRKLYLVFILFVWLFSNAPWTVPFISDRAFVLYPNGVCGFNIQKNIYFTLYIGISGFYIPLGIALLAGIFSVKYLKQVVQGSIFKLLLNASDCLVHPCIPFSSDCSEASDNPTFRGYVTCQTQRESTEGSASFIYKKFDFVTSASKFQRIKVYSVKKHFPVVATSLILLVLSRSLFYIYFGIGSIIPKLFPPDLSHSVYWVMHSYAVLAPFVHLILDKNLRRRISRFINEGTFELAPYSIDSAIAADTAFYGNNIVVPIFSVIKTPNLLRYNNHHHQLYNPANGNRMGTS